MGFQLSGLYFFGSGERRSTSWGSDLRNTGGANYGILTPRWHDRSIADGAADATVRDRVDGQGSGCTTVSSSSIARSSLASRSTAWICVSRSAFSLGGRRNARPDGRGVQHLQPRQLRVLHDDVQQSGAVRTAVVQRTRRRTMPRILQLGFHLAF